ncbi:uncharacterized protein LOC111335744 [Stylophora pistillata]|uniref:uncharacterized protein LOC111335744 n=1 Tax=Stylophora pistillata TaxID=50429 RepID=UPI000C03CECA|nr:uncharacterized protein LOC111335744 [Stylophora pistillata]XP_022797470.1 uncharacterized protein LOC111335744 [Stylophora pistillata]
MLYLSGNPGSGKSQLARSAAKRLNDEANELPFAIPFVMTLNAENSETLLESYISFARHCKCPEYSVTNTVSSKALSTDEKILNLMTLISTKIENYTSWLVIVDNVTSVSRVHFHLPDAGNEQWARGQMSVTTQDTVCIPATSSSIQHISVSAGMRLDDARSLLRVLSGVTDAKLEEKVAQVLDFQPLAFASAAIYLSQIRQNKSTLGWSDYLMKLERGQRSATETLLSQTNPGYPKSMTKAISLAVEKAMADDIVSHHMFTLLSMCAPNPILLDIIIQYIKEMDEEFEDEDMIRMRISRCSLLLFEEEEEEKEEEEKDCVYIRVHGVVHDVLKSATKDFARDQHVKVANKVLTSFSKFKDLDFVIIGKRIVPHLKAVILKIQHLLLEQGIPHNSESDLTTLCSNRHVFSALGRVCRNHCELHAALIYFKVELEIINLGKGCGDSEKATCYNDLGIVHIYQGHLEHGKAYFKSALEIDLKNLGPEHVDVAASYNNLGNVYRKLGEREEAKRCYERALDIREKKLGADHVNVAISYHNLGGLLSDQGEKTTAKDYYLRGLDICLKKLGREHVKVATFYNNLASVLFDLGDKEKARHYYNLALNIRLKKLGADHVDVAASYNNLGILHCDLGNLEKAKDYYELAMNIFLTKLGSDHESVAISFNNLGNVLSKMDVMEKAKDYLVRALDIRVKKLGPEHAAVADSYNNLGIVHKKLGEKELARECHSRALNIRIRNVGAENVKVAASYNSLGGVYRDLGDLKRAKNCHEKALEIRL